MMSAANVSNAAGEHYGIARAPRRLDFSYFGTQRSGWLNPVVRLAADTLGGNLQPWLPHRLTDH